MDELKINPGYAIGISIALMVVAVYASDAVRAHSFLLGSSQQHTITSAPPTLDPGKDIHFVTADEWKEVGRRLTVLEGNETMSSGKVNLDNGYDTFTALGNDWQATKVKLEQSAQGCLVHGEILNRLYINKGNVSLNAIASNGGSDMAGTGAGVIGYAPAGHYVPFTLLIRTSEKLANIASIILYVDNTTGTTSPVY